MKTQLLSFLFFGFVYLGFGQIGFEEHIIPLSTNYNSFINVDIDNDGDIDLLTDLNNQILLFENTGVEPYFSNPQAIITNNSASRLLLNTILDIDGDNDLDIIVSFRAENSSDFSSFIVYKNIDGLGAFEINQTIGVQESPILSHADLDSDGDEDLIELMFLNSIAADSVISWYENTDGTGNFGERTVISSDSYIFYAVGADIDNDGDKDILSSIAGSPTVWYENLDGLGNFEAQDIIFSTYPPKISIPYDIDLDGDLDLLTTSFFDIFNPEESVDGLIEWYRNDGQGSFSYVQTIEFSSEENYVFNISDMDNDGDPDLVSISLQEIAWYENLDGLGNFGEKNIISETGYEYAGPLLVDVDSDGDTDVLINDSNNNQIIWFENLSTLSIIDLISNSIKFYPNPANTKITISGNQVITSARIFDVNGRQLKSFNNLSTKNLNVEVQDLSQGLYFITLKGVQLDQTLKFIKE